MTFTDDDLVLLKEKIRLWKRADIWQSDGERKLILGYMVPVLKALLARLEAAEDYCEEHGCTCSVCELKREAWRKVCGK